MEGGLKNVGSCLQGKSSWNGEHYYCVMADINMPILGDISNV